MGNPTSYLGKTLTWEGKQLKTISQAIGNTSISYSFEYDENGLRTSKTAAIASIGTTQTTSYYYNGTVLIGMEGLMCSMRFSYDASGHVVSVNYNGTEYYYVRNAQNDVVKLIDNNGNTVVEYLYDTWGKLLSVSGSLATSLGYDQPFRYRGYVYDNDTGWYYLQSRYYDPTTCRFISADVLLSTGQGVLGHNAFAYCLNNPVNMTDEGGCRALPFATLVSEGGTSDYRYSDYKRALMQQLAKKEKENEELERILDSIHEGEVTYYKDCIVVPTDLFDGSMSWYPFIFVSKTETRLWVIKHEYGHTIQKRHLGTAAYFIFVAVPSATNCKLFGNKQSDEEYNSFPWERSANIFGKVTLDEVDYTQGSEYLYFIYTIITHGN